MKYDLVLEGGLLVEGQFVSSAVCITDGSISSIRRSTPSPSEAGEIVRHGRSLMMPGVIDTHVHFREPGQTHKEDFQTGTTSAAFGGVTSVVDMPNNTPPTVDGGSLREKLDLVKGKSVVDFGLYLMITPETVTSGLEDLLTGPSDRPTALKAFLGRSTNSLEFVNISDLSSFSDLLLRSRALLAVHPESGGHLREAKEGYRSKKIARDHDTNRPPIAERVAVDEAVSALGPAASRLHLLHMSTRDGLESARSSGATVEITPHHLFLDIKWAEDNLENEALGKMNPPLRNTSHRAYLWQSLNDGVLMLCLKTV